MLISEAYELSLVGELSLYALILYQVILLMLRETTIVAIGVIIVNIKLVFVAASLLSIQYYRVRAKTDWFEYKLIRTCSIGETCLPLG